MDGLAGMVGCMCIVTAGRAWVMVGKGMWGRDGEEDEGGYGAGWDCVDAIVGLFEMEWDCMGLYVGGESVIYGVISIGLIWIRAYLRSGT